MTRNGVRFLGRSRFLRSVAILAGGSAIAQVLPIVCTPILTRIYSPSQFGLFALLNAFVALVAPVVTLDLSRAVVSARDDTEASDLTTLSGLIVVPVTVIASTVFLLMVVNSWFGFGDLPLGAVPLVVAALIFSGAFQALRYLLIRMGQYSVIAKAAVAQSIGRVGTQMIIGLVNGTWWGLALGGSLGFGFGVREMWLAASSEIRRQSFPINWTRLRSVLADHKKFPMISAPSTLVNSLALALPVPLISSQYGLVEAGQYSLAARLLVLPLTLISTSVADVFHNRIAAYAREDSSNALPFLVKVAGGLFALGLLPMLIVGYWGEELWVVAFGDQWRESGIMAGLLVPWMLMKFVVSPLSRVVVVYQAQEFRLIYDIISLISVAGILSVGPRMNWSPEQTIWVLGWSQAVVYGIYFLILVYIVRSREVA